MSERVKRGPDPVYPWESWTDGEWHTAIQGVDFDSDTPPRSFQSYLYGKAPSFGLRATASVRGSSVRFRFYAPETEAAK
jgi:hypothetical protein